MTRINWGAIFALIALITICIGTGAYLTAQVGAESDVPGLVVRSISASESDNGHFYENRDLLAQESSAASARRMVVVSLFGLLITAAGTLLLYNQIVLTRDAVKETSQATIAMKAANDIAREIGQAQTRAYLSIKSVRIILTDGVPYCTLSLENSGQSPAAEANILIVPEVVYTSHDRIDAQNPRKSIDFGKSDSKAGSISSGELVENIVVPFLPKNNIDAPLDKLGSIILDLQSDCFIYATFFVKWIDVFGVECDCGGSFIARRFSRSLSLGKGRIGYGDAEVRTDVYDTKAWFDRRRI